MRKVLSSAVAVGVCLLAVLVLSEGVSAYDVRLQYYHTSEGMIDFQRDGYCPTAVTSSHSFMPFSQAFVAKGKSAMGSVGTDDIAPVGAMSRKAVCLDHLCQWQYYKGLFTDNEITFSNGVQLDPTVSVGQRNSVPVEGYLSFDFVDTWAHPFPVGWENISYFGARQVAFFKNGSTKNAMIMTYFQHWVCESYIYGPEDHSWFPTWLNGDPMTPTLEGQSYISHCGKKIETDSRGRYIDVSCDNSFPWWAALIIAVCGLITITAIILIVWCCCCVCNRRDREKKRQDKIATTDDNQGYIPSQSEIGMSRRGGFGTSESDHSDDDERSFSESGTGTNASSTRSSASTV